MKKPARSSKKSQKHAKTIITPRKSKPKPSAQIREEFFTMASQEWLAKIQLLQPTSPVDPGYGVPITPPGFWGGVAPPLPTHPIAPGGPPPGIWPGPGYPAHPIAPGGPPPGYWGGIAPPYPDQGLPVPPVYPAHPIIIPPDSVGPGEPSHPIVLPPPIGPAHPIVIPPDAIAPGVPSHPIYIPVYPAHPIVIPPGSIADGKPEHPIVLPPVAPVTPEHPIVLPPDAEIPPNAAGIFEWKAVWAPSTGWVVIAVPNFEHPTPGVRAGGAPKK